MADRFFELDKNSFSRYLGRGLCLMIEVSHSLFEESFYLINNTVAITYNGQEYSACPFDIILPSQTEQNGTQLTISNIHNTVSKEIKKTINSNENILIKLYIANIESNDIERISKGEYEVISLTISNDAVVATINIRHCLDINLGSIRYNKQNFPNLFL